MATTQELEDCIRKLMVEIGRQRTVIAKQQMEIDTLVSWAENDRDALMMLQAIYRNPNTSEGSRLRAASAAVAYERAKPPSLVAVAPVKLFDILEARRAQGKVIEQAPGPMIDSGPDAA
jgi:hypothetical protein